MIPERDKIKTLMDAQFLAKAVSAHSNQALAIFYFTYAGLLVMHGRCGPFNRPIDEAVLQNNIITAVQSGSRTIESSNIVPNVDVMREDALSIARKAIVPTIQAMRKMKLLNADNQLSDEALADAAYIQEHGFGQFVMHKLKIDVSNLCN